MAMVGGRRTSLMKSLLDELVRLSVERLGGGLEVPDSAVDELGGLGRGAARKVIALDQCHAQASRRSVESDAAAGGASADHDDVLHARAQRSDTRND